MSGKRKGHGRRSSDSPVTIEIDKPLDAMSEELSRLLLELNKGRTVRVKQHAEIKAVADAHRRWTDDLHRSISFNEVVAVVGSGVALGVATLAFAPAAPIVAGVASFVGMGLGGYLSTKDKRTRSVR